MLESLYRHNYINHPAYGVTVTPGTRLMMNSAATVAFGFPTSFGLVCNIRECTYHLTQVSTPEKKLAVQITDIDGVHVDNMNVLESSQRQIGKNLAT